MLVSTGDSTSCPDGARREGELAFGLRLCVSSEQASGLCAVRDVMLDSNKSILFVFLLFSSLAVFRTRGTFYESNTKEERKNRTRNPRGNMPELVKTYGMNRSRARAPSLERGGMLDSGLFLQLLGPLGLGGEMEERTRRVVGSLSWSG